MTITTDFDFLVGTWQVSHRQLAHPLTGSDETITTDESQASVSRYFDGAVSVEEISFPTFGSSGMGLRLYDAAAREWSVHWISSRDGRVGDPVRGPWAGDGCRLVGEETHTDGRPIRVTYEWSGITPEQAHWQQAASLDGGQTWETGWEMDFHRTGDRPSPVPADHLDKVTGDFDFLQGRWRIQHRRLRSRLTGCTDWDEFESEFDARTHLNGLVSLDEGALVGVDGAAYRGMTFRTYDVEAGEWALHWFDSRNLAMDRTPVRGRFVDGVGEFVAEDEHAGIPILCRFRWTVVDAEHAGWEQAFSTDDGRTWEVNWVMEETWVG